MGPGQPREGQGGGTRGEKRGRLTRKNREFNLIIVGLELRRKLQDLSWGHIVNTPVCLAKEFRLYPKSHDFQQESTSTRRDIRGNESSGVETIDCQW